MSRNPLGKTFSYLLLDSLTLIDTGVPTEEAYKGLTEELDAVGVKPGDIQRVILTHLHRDHTGLTDRLRALGAEVIVSTTAVQRIEALGGSLEKIYELMRDETRLFGGKKYLDYLSRFQDSYKGRPAPIEYDGTLSDGEELTLGERRFTVIHTPGHAPEHIVLHCREDRFLISGDHVLPKITSHISLHSYENRDPLNDYIVSLDKVKDLEVDTVLPAHEWIFKDLAARVEQLKQHHRNRLDEMMDKLKHGPKTVYDIGSLVHWDSRPWPEMSFWTKRMAATETYAHMVYLRNSGAVVEEESDGVLYYSLP